VHYQPKCCGIALVLHEDIPLADTPTANAQVATKSLKLVDGPISYQEPIGIIVIQPATRINGAVVISYVTKDIGDSDDSTPKRDGGHHQG
jgi:hypothetical protein